MKFSKVILVSILTFASLFSVRTSTEAAIVSKQHNRVFTIQDDHVDIKETKTSRVIQEGFQISPGSTDGFTVFSPIEGDPEYQDKLQKTLDSIVVTNGSGNSVDYEMSETTSGNYEIVITNQNNVTFGNIYTVNLQYKSYGLLINTGAIKDIFIPGFPDDYSFENDNYTETVETQILIERQYPEVNFVSPEQPVSTVNSNRVIDIPVGDLIGNSAWVQLGTEQYFEFEINQTLPKTSSIPFAINTFSLPVPRDINSGPISQKVYYTEISPEPFSVTVDDEENLIFKFKNSAAKDLDIKIKGYASLSQFDNFSFESGGKISDITSDFDKYLEPANYWEVDDNQIQATAAEIRGGNDDIYTIVSDTFEFVVDRIDYSFVKKNGLNDRQGALTTLNGGAAVCMEYSDLFITLLRAQGVPARAAFGYGYGTSDFEARQDNTINHQWAEVYIPNLDTWVAIDTTWGEFGSDLIGGDLNHFYSHVASLDPETPSTSSASFFGSLKEIPERDMEIFIVESLPNTSASDQSAILNKYPEPPSSEELINALELQNRIIDDLVSDLLNTESPVIINIFKLLVLLSPIMVLIFVVMYAQKKKHRKSTKPKQNSINNPFKVSQ